MNCQQCGAPMKPGVKFCGKCGAKTEDNEQQAAVSPAAAPSGATREWFISVNGQNHGPYATAELAGYVSEGRVSPATFAWKQGMEGWSKISDIPEFSAAAPTTAPAQSPAPSEESSAAEQKPAAMKKKAVAQESQEDDVEFDPRARKKYEREKAKREKAEMKDEARRKRRDAKEKKESVKVMKTREGEVHRFYESPVFVLIALIIAPFISLAPLWISRRLSSATKLLLTMIFGTIWGLLIFFHMSPDIYKPYQEDALLDLHSGFSEETYADIKYLFPRDTVINMLAGADGACEIIKKPVIGEMEKCDWSQVFDDGSIHIIVFFKSDKVIRKKWFESTEKEVE